LDVAVGVVGWEVYLFDNYFHVFVSDWSVCDKIQFSYDTLTLYFDINNLSIPSFYFSANECTNDDCYTYSDAAPYTYDELPNFFTKAFGPHGDGWYGVNSCDDSP
jgi:hypothetical protein